MKKVLLVITMVLLLVCAFALTAGAEDCAHKDNWEIKFGPDGVLGSWEAINVCPDCGVAVKDEFCEPIVTSRGYSYYVDSFSQGFSVNRTMIAKYEEYSGEAFDFGLVVGVSNQIGTSPVSTDGTIQDKAVMFDFTESSTSLFDLKIVNIPSDQLNTKIVACMYSISGDEVTYIDGENVYSGVAGVSYNEVVDVVKNGGIPQGLEEYRALTPEEMDIICSQYWQSNHSYQYGVRRTTENTPEKFASTRMFSRDELPSGSYVVIANGWQARPEVWKTGEDGNVKKQTGTRPGNKSAGTYSIEALWQDSDSAKSDYKYMAFNISEVNGGYLENMTPEGLSKVLQIYVPYTTKVATNEVEAQENVSVEGMKLLEWTTDNLKNGKYWSNTKLPTTINSESSYYATCLFTEETLPVGSVIEINEGWLYRAEYWKNSASVSGGPRGPMVDTYRIVVTEEFWSGISERGFNISTLSKDTLSSDNWDEVASAFKIYIPVE